MNDSPKSTSFTQLNTWKEGHALVIQTFKLLKTFPREQQFILVSQMSRAVVSITSNIAEGFGRSSYKEKIQFYYIALGSLIELQNQLLISKDVGFISKDEFEKLAGQTVVVQKLLSGLIKYAKNK